MYPSHFSSSSPFSFSASGCFRRAPPRRPGRPSLRGVCALGAGRLPFFLPVPFLVAAPAAVAGVLPALFLGPFSVPVFASLGSSLLLGLLVLPAFFLRRLRPR